MMPLNSCELNKCLLVIKFSKQVTILIVCLPNDKNGANGNIIMTTKTIGSGLFIYQCPDVGNTINAKKQPTWSCTRMSRSVNNC